MHKFLKIIKDLVILLLKKLFELIGDFCEIYSACMRYDFDDIIDNSNKKKQRNAVTLYYGISLNI